MCARRFETSRKKHGFTLIEVLVVVAIIALLIAILLPSLSRARAMSRMVQCQSNMKQIATGFSMYVVETKGHLPGCVYDDYADWMGLANRPGWTGQQPEDGTIWKYMGRSKAVYHCPEYFYDMRLKVKRTAFNYSFYLVLSGARPEDLVGAHHTLGTATGALWNSKDHRTSPTRPMGAFAGVPMLVEEDTTCNLTDAYDPSASGDDGSLAFSDSLTERHLQTGGTRGYGNIAFTDSHVGRMSLKAPSKYLNTSGDGWTSDDVCFRTRGGKWISPYYLSVRGYTGYGGILNAPAASAVSVLH